jgi:4-diphosphocytidyl-2-C-methyl-D-erythritol kinase
MTSKMKETKFEVDAPAKVNVCLLVAGRRADGYHDVATVMAPLELADALTITVKAGRGVNVSCDGAGVPTGERNLAGQAALAFLAAANVDARVDIHLAKNVPVGAGLGGGSSDAAAALQALNEHFGRPLGEDTLWHLARRLGSDVPFFLRPGWGFATGRGDFVTPVPGPAGVPLLLAAPRRSVQTTRVYKALTADEYAPNADALWKVLARLDGPPTAWWSAGENSLERPALRAFPFLEELKDALAELGVDGARLSGSGGAFAAPATDGEKAKAAAAELTARGYWATITATR